MYVCVSTKKYLHIIAYHSFHSIYGSFIYSQIFLFDPINTEESLKSLGIRVPCSLGFQGGSKEPACQCRRQEMQIQSLGWKDPLEEGMATHSSILAWRIPRTEELGRLQSIGLQRVGHH